MLKIGELSSICRVSTKTLRYYAEIGLILPEEINPENGYRYYSINQLEMMLFINRLKAYHFSLEEIKAILESEEAMDDKLYVALSKKKKEISMQIVMYKNMLEQIDADMSAIPFIRDGIQRCICGSDAGYLWDAAVRPAGDG